MTIRIDFSDFWPGFNKHDNFFFHLLKSHFDIEISATPDFLIYSSFGKEYLKYDTKVVKIYYTGENIRPDFTDCHYALSFDYLECKNHLRWPYFMLSTNPERLNQPIDVESVFREKTAFCNFVYSNNRGKRRQVFFEKLIKYKKVDSGGKVMNNMGYRVDDKLVFIKQYKFTIAFENASYPGYTTEKIIEPLSVNSIPIYWGNPLVDLDFNTKSFLNAHDFKNDEELIERIIELDQNDDLYKQYLAQPKFKDGIIPPNLRQEVLVDFFSMVFTEKQIHPLAPKTASYYIQKWFKPVRRFD